MGKNKEFYSLREAALFLSIPHGTLKHQVMVQKLMTGIVVGRTTVFSIEQLEDLRDNGKTNIKLDPDKVLGTNKAAKLVGLTGTNLKYHASQGHVKSSLLGKSLLFNYDDLLSFKAAREGDVL